jgi:hypothetical protein
MNSLSDVLDSYEVVNLEFWHENNFILFLVARWHSPSKDLE